MPPVIIAAVAAYAGWITAAQLILTVVAYSLTQYQASRMRRKARDNYNQSLQDRLVMTSTVEQARTRCYGRVRNVDGILFKATWGSKKEQYTLVIALCGHEIDGVEKLMFGDTEIVIDSEGLVGTAPWNGLKTDTLSATVPSGFNGITLDDTPDPGSVKAIAETPDGEVEITPTVSGNTVTFSSDFSGFFKRIAYQKTLPKQKARVRVFNGGDGQDLSATLAERFPGMIVPGAHLFAGMACLLVDLLYDQDAFPNGVPNPITAVFRGAKVFDPRTGTTAWTENPALIARDWSLYANGGGCSAADLVSEDFIAAANACDVSHAFTSVNGSGSSTTTTRPMYTCGIVCDTSANPMETLSAICESMAGDFAWPGGKLSVRAGAYTMPAWTIDGDWLSDKGQIEMVKDAPRSELINIITPTIANSANRYIAAPLPRVVADAYVAVDGEEYPQEIQLEGVTDSDHAAHISSVMLKDARAAKTYTLPCNLKGLQVKVGQNATVNIPEIGLSNEVMRCVGWKLDFEQSCCYLTMKSTSAAIFDPDATFKRDDALPSTSLPNPFFVPTVSGLTLASGTAHLFIQSDGTIVPRMLASWSAATDQGVIDGGAVDVRYGNLNTDPAAWSVVSVPGSDTQVYLEGVEDMRYYGVMVRFRNKLVAGQWTKVSLHQVLGKSQPPAAVAGLAANRVLGALVLTRTPTTEPDWDNTIYEYSTNGGASWNLIPAVADRSGATWTAPVTGALKIRARDVDTSGNLGALSSVIDVTVAPDSIGTPSATLAIKINVGDFAGTTNYSEAYIHGRDNSGTATDTNGTIQVNGASVAVPKGVLVTGMGPVSAFIVWDSAGATFSTTVPSMTPWVMARKVSGGWQYDNNGGWVAFTPGPTHYVIGLIQTGGPDTNSAPGILSATMLSAAWVPDVIAALGTTADWTSVTSRPSTYRVAARGLSATGYPMESGVIDADTNAGIVGASAMYRVVKIHRTTKAVTDLGSFNPLSGAGGALAQCNAMAAALNSIDSSHICVVFTYDEPATNRRLGNLPAAMYRNGATRNVWGSDSFRYRGAYILVGIGGCGEGNGAENYSGEIDSDTNAWCETTFQITASGAFFVSGATRGATTLLDYGYIGSLDATTNVPYYQSTEPSPVVNGAIWVIPGGKTYQRVGGVWREYVQPGSVGTGELGSGAATSIVSSGVALDSWTLPAGDNLTQFRNLGAISYTNLTGGPVLLELSAVADHQMSAAAGAAGRLNVLSYLAYSIDGGPYTSNGPFFQAYRSADPGESLIWATTALDTVALAAGSSLTMLLSNRASTSGNYGSGSTVTSNQVKTRITVVKR